MVIVEKIDDKNIRITIGTVIGRYPACFAAFQSSNGKGVNINSTLLNVLKTISVPVEELEVNGVVYTDPEEAVVALNTFIGNFNKGGSNLPTPIDSPMSIPEKYVFLDDYTRDAYFASHVSEIRSGIFVVTGNVVQFYNGDYWINTSDPNLSEKLYNISSATDLLLNKLTEIPISESAYNALTPEEQEDKNYVII
ncbi:MAG: hypothetical protein LBJ72_10735 [Dysgonamonadaceae bacterium]|jgi:hypothetical protein|nr:hypothetical protein [Dysgonamonadaceae bacterium]